MFREKFYLVEIFPILQELRVYKLTFFKKFGKFIFSELKMSTLPDVIDAIFYTIGNRKFLLLGDIHVQYTGCPNKSLISELKDLFQNTPELRYDLMLETITTNLGNQPDRIQGRIIEEQIYLNTQELLLSRIQKELAPCFYNQRQSHQILREVHPMCQSNVWYHDINARSYTNFGYEDFHKLEEIDEDLCQLWLCRENPEILRKLFLSIIFDDDQAGFNERYQSNVLNFKNFNPSGFEIAIDIINKQLMRKLESMKSYDQEIILLDLNVLIMDLYAIARFERIYRGRDEVNDFPDVPENVIIIGGLAHTDIYDAYLYLRYPDHQREEFRARYNEKRCIRLPFTLEEFFTF